MKGRLAPGRRSGILRTLRSRSERVMTDPAGDILVIGIGNLLWADEGFGVRCVEAFDVDPKSEGAGCLSSANLTNHATGLMTCLLYTSPSPRD